MMAEMAVFLRLQQVVLAMQQAAVAADWDRFVELQRDYQQVSAGLPAIDSLDFDAQDRAKQADILRQVQDSLAVTLPLAEAWRAQLAAELAGAHNTAKLNRTYQS